MRKVLRLIAVLVLAVSLPVQGMATIAAGQCMAMGHHQDAGSHDHQAHGHDGVDSHDHASHSDHNSIPGHDNQDSKSAHCGPCTACCASASMAAFVATVIPSSPSNTKYAFSQLLPSGFEPEGVDRPPLAL